MTAPAPEDPHELEIGGARDAGHDCSELACHVHGGPAALPRRSDDEHALTVPDSRQVLEKKSAVVGPSTSDAASGGSSASGILASEAAAPDTHRYCP